MRVVAREMKCRHSVSVAIIYVERYDDVFRRRRTAAQQLARDRLVGGDLLGEKILDDFVVTGLAGEKQSRAGRRAVLRARDELDYEIVFAVSSADVQGSVACVAFESKMSAGCEETLNGRKLIGLAAPKKTGGELICSRKTMIKVLCKVMCFLPSKVLATHGITQLCSVSLIGQIIYLGPLHILLKFFRLLCIILIFYQ